MRVVFYIVALLIAVVSSTTYATEEQYVICKDSEDNVIQLKGTAVERRDGMLFIYYHDKPVAFVINMDCWVEDQTFYQDNQ